MQNLLRLGGRGTICLVLYVYLLQNNNRKTICRLSSGSQQQLYGGTFQLRINLCTLDTNNRSTSTCTRNRSTKYSLIKKTAHIKEQSTDLYETRWVEY